LANARLMSLTIERFKSYEAPTKVRFAPLTVLVGRNNSGKSTIIQALLLLKQTLGHPRKDVVLHLEGIVDALNLRELTFGWPEAENGATKGPAFVLTWSSDVDVAAALEQAKNPDLTTLGEKAGLPWVGSVASSVQRQMTTRLRLQFAETQGRIVLETLGLKSFEPQRVEHNRDDFLLTRQSDGAYAVRWDRERATQLDVDMHHFLPNLLIDRRNVGPRHRERSWHNAFLVLFAQPIEALRRLLLDFAYLGSMRTAPPAIYRPSSIPPDDIGVSGEYAAMMLHARQHDEVHYLPPLRVDGANVVVPQHIEARTTLAAVNEVLQQIGVDGALSLQDVQELGFRLMFGKASMQHVGRGLSYLLPVVQLALIADPCRFQNLGRTLTTDEYTSRCPTTAHFGFEEPEVHLHPKVQSRLAHWLVSLGMSRRQMIIETHSDHMVRRLRGLAARAPVGSELERWLLTNVNVVQVEQKEGRSELRASNLTADGSLMEHWPADFMDEASDEERAIYDASLDKRPPYAAASEVLMAGEPKEPERE
jgi:predicted ATPase